MIEVLAWCIGAHFIGDIALQSSWQADNKGKLWYVMLSHCIIWTTCICIPLRLFGYCTVWTPFWLCAGHYILDTAKCKFPNTPDYWRLIYPDQLLHLIQIIIAVIGGKP